MDSHYQRRREDLFLVAVNCSEVGGTCFCGSMDAGPEVRSGFDIALTEVSTRDEHAFLVEIGSRAGALMMNDVPHRVAGQAEMDEARRMIERVSRNMGRDMGGGDVRGLLLRNLEHPRWDDVAARCLTCGNCTMVCPTCFCTTVEEQTDFTLDSAGRTRRWDSCFTTDFSYIHGGSIRSSPRSRYRQWMTHKLATWFDQFGISGCVGCGRCITWCPVAIDITEEVREIRNSEEQNRSTQ